MDSTDEGLHKCQHKDQWFIPDWALCSLQFNRYLLYYFYVCFMCQAVEWILHSLIFNWYILFLYIKYIQVQCTLLCYQYFIFGHLLYYYGKFLHNLKVFKCIAFKSRMSKHDTCNSTMCNVEHIYSWWF